MVYMLTINNICRDITTEADFERLALEVFAFQAVKCAPYAEYLHLLGVNPQSIKRVANIPFMPIALFKSHRVYCGTEEPEKVFTSSTTSGDTPSKHYMASLSDYEKAFTAAFEQFYGSVEQWSIYALLPGYLEREGSSLVYMVDKLIGNGAGGGFFLYDHDELTRRLREDKNDKKLLLGVSYALLDLAERGESLPDGTVVMETGGMKGKRKEISKTELHEILCGAFGVNVIHSEYGMAELSSQAYSQGGGLFETPAWMRIIVRDANSPFRLLGESAMGGINIIDLANLYSCSFIQTDDMGRMSHEGRQFEIAGRLTGAQTRGCNLLLD